MGNLPASRFPRLARLGLQVSGPGDIERFRFGLDALIAGLEALSAAERAVGLATD